MEENNLGPKRSANIEKSMSNISNDAGPFGQGSGEDCADGFTYDDMALTEGVQDSKRKQNRFMNKKRKKDDLVLQALTHHASQNMLRDNSPIQKNSKTEIADDKSVELDIGEAVANTGTTSDGTPI